jgi:DNA-binding response OmpR family regulator
MSTVPQVLIVDDDLAAAEDYARLIKERTGLNAEFVGDAAQATSIVSRGGVNVVVLDQKMVPSGTELFLAMRKLDSRIRAVLLSGQATREEVGAALNLGFKKYVYKPVALSELPPVVRHEFIEYQNSLLFDVSADQPVLFYRRRGVLAGSSITYRFVRLEIISERYIREADWQELLTLHAGQTERRKFTRSNTWTLQLEDETSERMSASFGMDAKKVAKLSGQLKSEVTRRLKQNLASSVTEGEEFEQTFQLPPEPSDISQVHIRLRRVQQAPVYIEARVEIMAECGCCGKPTLLPVRALIATGALALRHVDRWSDGTTRVLDLGQTGAAI